MEKIGVLIVDDNQALVRLIADSLSRKSDIEVLGSAKDGLEALELTEKLMPDVMLLDIVMPRLDGFSTLEALGRTDAGRRPKVIMLTGLQGMILLCAR